MSAYETLVGGVLPYLTLLVFIGGMVYRIRSWVTSPQPGKMKLFNPNPETAGKGVLKEVFFFSSMFKGDKVLWFFSWVFHVTLALVVVGHFRVFTGLIDSMLMGMGMSAEGINTMSSVSGGAAGIILMATAALLLIRRFVTPRVREISGVPDFLALLLLLAIIATGNLMRFGEHFDLEQTRVWAWSLVTFSPQVPANGTFLIHALLAQLLIICIPFSKILHFGGVFFSQALVKRG